MGFVDDRRIEIAKTAEERRDGGGRFGHGGRRLEVGLEFGNRDQSFAPV